MARRRRGRSLEQREAVVKTRKQQELACARGCHDWWPDHKFDPADRGFGPPQYWSTNQRNPMPIWDKTTVICTACHRVTSISRINSVNRKRVRDIFNGFVQNTKAMRKRAKQALKGE